mmetsp:Transcript_23820/g.36819  ORF Transcript_23820/g.36819 Transcript_23820/m.36819 type:complete len:456 (+) Transcript_23820:28-1395(+)
MMSSYMGKALVAFLLLDVTSCLTFGVASSSSKTLRNSAPVADVDSTVSESFSYLDGVEQGAPDAILGIAQAFKACEDPRKVNVCVGAYRDSSGTPWVLPSVRAAEKQMLDTGANKEYLPIDGDAEYVKKALTFAYGADAPLERIAGVQSLSGTGACRIGGEFLGRFLPEGTKILIPNPTWGNHIAIFKEAGLVVERYRYYSRATNGLDADGLLEDISSAPDQSVILLHACAHNPTGCDPPMDVWKKIADICREKGHIVFFDSAYQGFASGDAEKDAQALRFFMDEGLPVMLAQSFAKNFGLYGERTGTLSIVCADEEQRERVMSQLKLVIRPMYSSPPLHGSSIVRTVLSDEKLTAQYYEECKTMADRIGLMRTTLVEKLKEAGSTHDWSHVTEQIGMFAFTGMNEDMCDEMTNDYAIYMTRDGRISLAGLNENNVEYVASAIHAITDGKPIKST